MYILKLESETRPFAVCENKGTFTKAIEEETLLTNVNIVKLNLPDWGETTSLEIKAIDEENQTTCFNVEVLKTVKY